MIYAFQHKSVKQSRLAFICSANLCLDAQNVHSLKRLPTCKVMINTRTQIQLDILEHSKRPEFMV